MYTDAIADILERAARTSIDTETAIASRGSVPLQDILNAQTDRALREHGICDRSATPAELQDTAASLRKSAPADVTPARHLAAVYRQAADWLDAQPYYGPASYRLGNDIIHAVEAYAQGRALYDALTTIAATLPGRTITDWEWNLSRSKSTAVSMLRTLAERHDSMVTAWNCRLATGATPLENNQPITVRHDLVTTDLAALWAARRDGQPRPVPADPEQRRALARGHLAAAAAAPSSVVAAFHQTRADELLAA